MYAGIALMRWPVFGICLVLQLLSAVVASSCYAAGSQSSRCCVLESAVTQPMVSVNFYTIGYAVTLAQFRPGCLLISCSTNVLTSLNLTTSPAAAVPPS
mgnify:CR=1 FL=1